MRDDFSDKTKITLAIRSAYICSNKGCRRLTIAPSESDQSNLIYIGCAAHITAASEGGPRFDASITPEERKSSSNGIYLCRSCAELIDKNGGADFPVEKLLSWKKDHENWLKENLNKEFGGSITESINHLKEDIRLMNQTGSKVLSVVDRNFELQKKLSTIGIGIELDNPIVLTNNDPFVFLLHVHCIGIGKDPSFICGNMYPTEEGMQVFYGNEKMPSNPMEAAWTKNPYVIQSQMARGRGDLRKCFTSQIRANNHEDLVRAIDLERAQLHFYISEQLSHNVIKMFFIVNGIVVECFNPNKLEAFPGLTNLESAEFQVPPQIMNRLPKSVRELKLVRFGKKGDDPRKVEMGLPNIEPTWFVRFPEVLNKFDDFSKLK